MTYAKKLPDTIRLSTPDLSFLIPETEDENGMYFPMSPVFCFPLKRTITAEQLGKALSRVNERFPQFRLGYKLDYAGNRWRRIPDAQLESYWPTCIESWHSGSDVNGKFGEALATNNTPFSKPIIFALDGHHLWVKIHHSLGDGKYMFHMLGYLLTAVDDPAAFEKLPDLPMNFGLPLWKLIFQTPQQGLRIVWGFLKSVSGYLKEFQQETAVQGTSEALAPIVSGSAMSVVTRLVPPDGMKQLNDLKNALSSDVKITLNTLLQALLAQRVAELGYTDQPPIYSVPVDLRRYLTNPAEFYPGNLLSQIRVKTSGHDYRDLKAECEEIQKKLDDQLPNFRPLLGGPGECLAAINPRSYKLMNRKWLLASINTDHRVLVFSNVGNLGPIWDQLAGFIDYSVGLFAGIPLMGGPPLACSFTITNGYGNLTLTYDPRRYSQQQAAAVLALFDADWIAAQFPGTASQEVSKHALIEQV